MDQGNKIRCQYGSKCYRKNANHLKQYSHLMEATDNDVEGKQNTRVRVKHRANSANESIKGQKSSSDQNSKSSAKPNPPTQNRKASQTHKNDSGSRGKKRLSSSPGRNNDKKKIKNTTQANTGSEDSNDDSDSDVKSNSWTYIKAPAQEKSSTGVNDLKGATAKDIIKYYYLVDMPPDFYAFFKFCESVNENDPLKSLNQFGLNLVGPFDLLAGTKVNVAERDLMLCHWRYYFDPPEFQTILASDSGFHIGYWRDSPEQLPVFLASNNPNKDCQFKIEGENIFGVVHNYVAEFIKTCDPFTKTKAGTFLVNLQKCAIKENIELEKSTLSIKSRTRKINSKTFHGVGIVVPVQKKTEVGYRPLCETDANIRKLCKLIIDANDKTEREELMEKLQPLITFANIANDECDFGNSLELGIDLFCMGSTVFDSIVEHLLTTAYSLLNRSEFGKIISVHLKNRRNDKNLSVL